MGDLSKNFSRREFECQGVGCCGGAAPVDSALVEALQQLRDQIEKPLTISSGFRCRTHNRRIGGAEGSQHTFGRAVDVLIPDGWTPETLAEEAERIPAFRAGGIGVYSAWVHLDVRPNGPARWKK